jgi:hypothetical protein
MSQVVTCVAACGQEEIGHSPAFFAFAARYEPPNFGAIGPSPTLYGPES